MNEDTCPPTKRARRSHNFGGCITYRRRHLKCDQAQPLCLTCRIAGIVCEGYHTGLRWISSSAASSLDDSNNPLHLKQPTRSHLYSETSRMSMSNDLQSKISTVSVSESLSELESRSKDIALANQNVAVGPFQVLNFKDATPPAQRPIPSPSQVESSVNSSSGGIFLAESPETLHSVDTIESINNINDFLDWSDLFELDFEEPAHLTDEVMLQTATNRPLSNLLSKDDQVQDLQLNESTLLENDLPPAEDIPHTIDENRNSPLGSIQVQDAQFLLKHFRSNVVPHISSLPVGRKCLWNTLHMRAAILSLAEILFDNSSEVSHAAMINLLAILAISARHLSHQLRNSESAQSEHWEQTSDVAINLSKDRFRSLTKAQESEGACSKYKELNMAFSVLIAYAILYNQQREARAYMIDTEKLLRTRGITKITISKKARMLHHLYTWTRIIGESTYVLRDYKNCELTTAMKANITSSRKRRGGSVNKLAATQDSTHRTKLDDFLRLDSMTLDRNGAHKEHEIGIRDIHLEESGEWPETMYMQLYGVRETWLSLVSQTTRLANVIDTIEAKNERNVNLLESLERRKQRLEDMVCSLAAKARLSESEIGLEQKPGAFMVRALDAALVIFFYRRIRNVNPWILQNHVDTVMTALKRFESSCREHGMEGPGSPWPCFLAGSEAMSQDQRKYFTDWLKRAFDLTGFHRFANMLSCLQDVWSRRDDLENSKSGTMTKATWIQVCRDKEIYPLLA